MTTAAGSKWRSLLCESSQLQLKATLLGGQSFRWKNYKSTGKGQSEDASGEFIGVFANIVWLLRQTERELQYRIVGEQLYPNAASTNAAQAPVNSETPEGKNNLAEVWMKVPEPKEFAKDSELLYPAAHYEQLLRIYFRLDVDLEQHYRKWIECHDHFANSAHRFYAVRQLDQDPVENLFSFICSQNNHITRISDLVEKLCTNYGDKICDHEGTTYWNFPSVEALANGAVEGRLRELGFGYRAKYIQGSAAKILSLGGLEWFRRLTELDYKAARTELIGLPGIGPKVADCVCLMSLNHLQAIPVDTHVFQLAKHYLSGLGNKTQAVTDKQYVLVADKFREIYGPYAGWAQTVLFCSDLRQFKDRNENRAPPGDKAVPVPKKKAKKGN
uniref:N-glycosylase/DNA lyase n=2 Tax=Anopheles albimanus TaxID=7167 RepID=A0A182F6X6_ANOAL